ncbi:MAG: beta-ketoacyl-[acyl-carrier-protein] synthase family protein [Sedimentisphaerales bacterium]|nr:beta-ketoacyl-[acyl-carrier-protein] synthase family protein [Sedimentisphaerales bacterium]
MARRRVVITGMGAVTPLAHSVEELWQKLLAGESGIRPTTVFDAGTFPTQFSAEVRDYDVRDVLPPEVGAIHRQAGRHSGFILGAALQAWRQANLPLPLAEEGVPMPQALPPTDRIGIYLGAGEGPVDFDNFVGAIIAGWQSDSKQIDWGRWADHALATMDAMRELGQEPNMPSAHLSQLFRVRGPCFSCLTACAASTQAIGEATELIRDGQADIMIAGGAHSMIHPLGITGFNRLTALSRRNDSPARASRPFDRDRDGFVVAEGAGVIILEELEVARRRQAPILAEVLGYGSTTDAFRVTDQHDQGRGGIAAVRLALQDAGLNVEDIDYISAHGTGTKENDSIETLVIKSVFGPLAYKIPVSSVKSMLGHLIAAAGVVEMITCVLAIRDQKLPPTINLENPDPLCDLDYVPNQARAATVEVAMSNSFGFGGQNDTVIIGKWPN